jgi:hypothetical protein
MYECPKCGSSNLYRSKARNRWEQWRKQITAKRPFRCHQCNWRGWGDDFGPRFGELEREMAFEALAPLSPDLTRDSGRSNQEPRPEPDLANLDAAQTWRRRTDSTQN